jgi:hypothetical protein
MTTAPTTADKSATMMRVSAQPSSPYATAGTTGDKVDVVSVNIVV